MLLASLSGQTIFIQRKLFGLAFLNLLGLTKPRIIFDFDDAVFVKRSGKNDQKTLSRFEAIIRNAILILAGNQHLANKAKLYVNHERVLLAPTTIDTEKYARTRHAGAPTKHLVWIGSSSTRKYLESASEALTSIAQRFPEVTLKVISDFEWSHPDMKVECVRWSEESEAEQLSGCLAGIAPMPDTAWTRGKCALKAIQYMAMGVPVIASDCGMHKNLIESGKTGLLATDPTEWADSVERLISDPTLASSLGANAKALVRTHYDSKVQSQAIARAIGMSLDASTSQSMHTLKQKRHLF